MQKLPISVLILARNEAKMIRRAVESAQFAEDIVVIDACSTDGTQEIAKSLGARVIERPWTNFSEQRNFSLSQARHDWVLVLDADEAVTPALVDWLNKFMANPPTGKHGFKIKRAEYFLGRRIYGACWNPSYQDRLFRRAKAKYVGTIHEYPEVEGGMDLAPVTALIDHNPNVTVESFLEKMNRYTTIEAYDRYQLGQRTSIPHMCVVFFANWFKNYFNYGGYKDGVYGFVICLMEAVSRTVRHIKLWQIQEMVKKGNVAFLPQNTLELGATMHRKFEGQQPVESAQK
jgi:glycosyltransferase involved in cell wall biosynthesis